jgi:hypothetical protein
VPQGSVLYPRSPTLALTSPLWQELHPAPRRHADLQSPPPARNNVRHWRWLACYLRASPGFRQTTLFRDSNITAVTSPLRRAKGVLPVFIRHALLPCLSVIFILTAVNICYSFTWLSLRASTSYRSMNSGRCLWSIPFHKRFHNRPQSLGCDLTVACFCLPPFKCLHTGHSFNCFGYTIFICWHLNFPKYHWKQPSEAWKTWSSWFLKFMDHYEILHKCGQRMSELVIQYVQILEKDISIIYKAPVGI